MIAMQDTYDPFSFLLSEIQAYDAGQRNWNVELREHYLDELLADEAEEIAWGRRHLTIVYGPEWDPVSEQILDEHRFAHDDVPVVAIELQSESQLKDVTRLLLKAEINIHYVYPFLFRPNGRYGLVVRTEAQELAASVLSSHGITVLGRNDIAR
jgi:hypothetical protein